MTDLSALTSLSPVAEASQRSRFGVARGSEHGNSLRGCLVAVSVQKSPPQRNPFGRTCDVAVEPQIRKHFHRAADGVYAYFSLHAFRQSSSLSLLFAFLFFPFQLSILVPSATEGANTTACSSLLLISDVAASQITCWQRMASIVHVSARTLV